MNTVAQRTDAEIAASPARSFDMKLEVVVIPVADVDRSKRFYGDLGWRLDADFVVGDQFRGVQFTPPGSPCSVHFGKGITSAMPGSASGLFLVVSDLGASRSALISRGIDVSEVFHHTAPGMPFLPGPHPDRRSYASYASFKDPDGNTWLLQEIRERLPGRKSTRETSFESPKDLASALRRAEAAHIEHEKRTGQRDVDWPRWYAEYLVREQAGEELPT